MYSTHAGRRILSAALVVILMAGLIAVANMPSVSRAQDGGPTTAIAYGEAMEGLLGVDGSSTYTFEAEDGDMVEIDVMGFGFAPYIQLLSENQTDILAEETNTRNTNTVHLEHLVSGGGSYSIVVRGVDVDTGNFGISLARVEASMTPLTTIASGESVQGELTTADSSAAYSFAGDADRAIVLTVRSLTEGFRPGIKVMTNTHEMVAHVEAGHALGNSITLGAGETNYTVVVELGDFADSAQYQITLIGGSVGATTAPTEGCFVTAENRVNIREGGSTNHLIIGVLGEGNFLPVVGFNPENGVWYQVQLPDGRTGWVSSQVTTQGGTCDGLPQADYPPAEDVEATAEPTEDVTEEPTEEATEEPTVEATVEPTTEGTVEPTLDGSVTPASTLETLVPTITVTLDPAEPTQTP